MCTVVVCMRDSRKIEVARYKFATTREAKLGRIGIMTQWIKKNKMKVLVSAIIPPKE